LYLIVIETGNRSADSESIIKGLVHPENEMKILSVFTHPHVVPTP